jgi:hypothetical protein
MLTSCSVTIQEPLVGRDVFRSYLEVTYGLKETDIKEVDGIGVLYVRLPETSIPYVYGDLGIITYKPETGFIDDRSKEREFCKEVSAKIEQYLKWVFGTSDILYTFELQEDKGARLIVYADAAYPETAAKFIRKELNMEVEIRSLQ